MSDLTEKSSIYSAFINGIRSYLETEDDAEKQSKAAATHRIALSLRPYFPPAFSIDIDTDGADILIHKEGEAPLAVFWSKRYLTGKQRKKAEAFSKKNKAVLTLAFTPLPGNDFFLLYRFSEELIDYIHVDKKTGAETTIKQSPVADRKSGKQLHLKLRSPRRK